MTLGVGKIPKDRFETAGNTTLPTLGEEVKLEKELSKAPGYADVEKGETALPNGDSKTIL